MARGIKRKRIDEYVSGSDTESSDDFIVNSDDEGIAFDSPAASKQVNRHVEKLREALGLTDVEIKRLREEQNKTDKKCSTTPSTNVGRTRPPPQIVVFNDPTKRKMV